MRRVRGRSAADGDLRGRRTVSRVASSSFGPGVEGALVATARRAGPPPARVSRAQPLPAGPCRVAFSRILVAGKDDGEWPGPAPGRRPPYVWRGHRSALGSIAVDADLGRGGDCRARFESIAGETGKLGALALARSFVRQSFVRVRQFRHVHPVARPSQAPARVLEKPLLWRRRPGGSHTQARTGRTRTVTYWCPSASLRRQTSTGEASAESPRECAAGTSDARSFIDNFNM